MKQKFFLSTILLLLTISLTFNNIQSYQHDDQHLTVSESSSNSIELTQDEELRPLLASIKDNGFLIRERNDTVGNGAIYHGELYKNVTITYIVVNGNNETNLRLYADVPGNLSLSRTEVFENESLAFKFVNTTYEINYTVPFSFPAIFYDNATVSYYSVELNVSIEFITFYAAIGANGPSELELIKPMNFITTLQNWETESQDDFYIQLERVNITLSAQNATNVDEFGIKYKKSGSPNWIDLNFTYTYTSYFL
jgi:hypothetical protein